MRYWLCFWGLLLVLGQKTKDKATERRFLRRSSWLEDVQSHAPIIRGHSPLVNLSAFPGTVGDNEDVLLTITLDGLQASPQDYVTIACGQQTGPDDYIDMQHVPLSQQPITDVTFVASDLASVSCPSGFTKYPQDFNQGAGGKYIFLCFTVSQSAGSPISALTAVTAETASTAQCPSGYTVVPQDLNEGARGRTTGLFLCVSHVNYTPGSRSVLAFSMIDSNSALQPCPPGFVPIVGANGQSIDFKQGTQGPHLTVCTKPDASSTAQVRFAQLVFLRCNYTFGFVHVDQSNKHVEMASVIVPARDPLGTPKQGHISLTGKPDEMVVQYVTGTFHGRPSVRYGVATSNLSQLAFGTTRTYHATNMCEAPATNISQQWFRDPGFHHTVQLTGLAPGVTYYYQFGNNVDGWSTVRSFQSILPAGGTQEVRFIAYADMGLDGGEAASTTAQLVLKEVLFNGFNHFLLHFGDICYARGTGFMWDQWGTLIEPYASYVPYMVSTGNHEYDHISGGQNDPSKAPGEGFHPIWGNFGADSSGECAVPIVARYNTPTNGNGLFWYSFNYGLVHVIQFSSEHDWTKGSVQYKWLQKDLESVNRTATPWVVVTAHRMMYTTQLCEDGDYIVSTHMRAELEDLFYSNGVNAMLVGHQHSYERSCPVYRNECRSDGQGIVHVVVGSAGAGLEGCGFSPEFGNFSLVHVNTWGYLRATASPQTLKFEFVRNDEASIFDEVVIPPWDAK